MAPEDYVFMNLERVPVQLRDEVGVPFTLMPNKAVAGEFYARYAKPASELSMVRRDRVSPDVIVRVAVPRGQHIADHWSRISKKVDPLLIHLPDPTARVSPTPVNLSGSPTPVPPAYVALTEPEDEVVTEEEVSEGSVEEEVGEVETEESTKVDEVTATKSAPRTRKKKRNRK